MWNKLRPLLGPALFVWIVAGLVDLVVLKLFGLPPIALDAWRGAIIIGALLVLGDRYAVELEDGSLLTPAPAVLVAGLAVAGWPLLPVAALGGTLVSAALRNRTPRQAVADAGTRCLVAALITPVYLLTQPAAALPYSTLRGVLGLLAIGVIAYAVKLILGAEGDQPAGLVDRLRARLAVMRWYVLAMIPLGGLLGALWTFSPWAFLLGLVPLAVAQRSFGSEVRLRRTTEDVTRLAVQRELLATRLERLLALATAMKGTLEVDAMLEILCRRLAAMMEAPAGWAILLDEGGRPQLMTSHNVPFADSATPAIVDPTSYAALLERGRVMIVTDDRRQLLAPAVPGDAPRWAAVLSIPLIGEKQTLGAICLAFEHLRGLEADEQRVLTSFAHQAAVSVENARLFDELHRKQDELIQSSKLAAVGTFAAGIAHEFNNLLGSMLGYAELGYYAEETADKNQSLQVVIQACRRGRSITRGLLTFARRQSSHRALADVTDAVDEVLTLVEIDMRKARIEVVREVEPVPLTLCDLGQIAQVVLNLITNARDAMKPDGGRLTVRLRSRPSPDPAQNDAIEIAVADTGAGIPAEIRDKIFEPFVTTKGTLGGNQTPGTGLGLSVSYGIVRDHGGTIEVDSTVGRGTTMIVRLPVVHILEEEEAAVGQL
jgi:two-component system, NtrC family, sensor kinase